MQSSSVAHAFANDSDEEDRKDAARLTASEMFDKKYSTNKAKKLIKESLEIDPSIYEYDEVYDSFKRTRGDTEEQKEADKEKKPKYVDALLKAHKRRELQKLVHDDHMYKKEREKEAGQFDDSEAFITDSYRKKIAEREAFRQEVELEDRMDEVKDVKGQQMWQQAFHRKMLEDITDPGTTTVKAEVAKKEVKTDVDIKTEAKETTDASPSRASTSEQSPSRRRRKSSPNGETFQRRRDEPSSRTANNSRSDVIRDQHSRRRETSQHKNTSDDRKSSTGRQRPQTAGNAEKSTTKERMTRIRAIIKQRNGPEEIEAARQRYFERQSLVPPV